MKHYFIYPSPCDRNRFSESGSSPNQFLFFLVWLPNRSVNARPVRARVCFLGVSRATGEGKERGQGPTVPADVSLASGHLETGNVPPQRAAQRARGGTRCDWEPGPEPSAHLSPGLAASTSRWWVVPSGSQEGARPPGDHQRLWDSILDETDLELPTTAHPLFLGTVREGPLGQRGILKVQGLHVFLGVCVRGVFDEERRKAQAQKPAGKSLRG